MENTQAETSRDGDAPVDVSNHPEFLSYYEEQSKRPHVAEQCRRLKDVLLRFYALHAGTAIPSSLNVIDVGCGAGTQSIVWAEAGHKVHGVDVSERLIGVAKERMEQAKVAVEFSVGVATSLPLPDAVMDVCLLPELLEHVPDWRKTLEECARVLKPGGMLYLSTTNALCPLQNEFLLPLYSWYPGFVKRICEEKARTTHRAWVNYATYPAINWFSHPGLGKVLGGMGFQCHDRFDIMDLSKKPKWLAWLMRNVVLKQRLFRHLAYLFTVATVIVAIKSEKPA